MDVGVRNWGVIFETKSAEKLPATFWEPPGLKPRLSDNIQRKSISLTPGFNPEIRPKVARKNSLIFISKITLQLQTQVY